MRSAGKLPTEDQARRFVSYLLTKNMTAKADPDNGEFAIWIHEEDQLENARQELDAFRAEPNHERYTRVERQASAIRREQLKQAEESRRRVQDMRQQWGRPAATGRPLTLALIFISIGVTVFSSFGNHNSATAQALLFVNPVKFHEIDGLRAVVNAPASREALEAKTVSIRQGQVWRLVTPIFVHYSMPHIIFNMIMTYQLGGILEQRLGSVRLGLLVLAIALLSTALTVAMPYRLTYPFDQPGSPFLGGMSGVIYGLAGYLWAKTLTDPMPGIQLNPMFLYILLGWIVLGITGILDNMIGGTISNWGHLLGLVVGFAVPYIEAAFSKR